MKLRLKIRSKILLILLGIFLLSLVSFYIVSYKEIKNLGEDSIDSIKKLGSAVSKETGEALKEGTKDYLLNLSKNQADISNKTLESVKNDINLMSEFALTLWNDDSDNFKANPPTASTIAENKKRVPIYKIAKCTKYNEVKNELSSLGNMKYVFKPILDNDPNILRVYLGTQTGITIIYSNTTLQNIDLDPRIRPWYKAAAKSKAVIWTNYNDVWDDGLVFTCAKACFDKEGKLLGVIAADVTLDALYESIIATQIGDKGYARLIDEKGAVVPSGHDTINEDFSGIIDKMHSQKQGIEECTFMDGEKFVAYAPIPSINCILAIIMPHDEILMPVNQAVKRINASTDLTYASMNEAIENIITNFGLLFVLIFIIVLFISIFSAKRITKPIGDLNEGVKAVGNGNLDLSLDIHTGDEVEELSISFNKMTTDLKTYIKNLEITTAEKERIESELKVAHSIQSSMLPRIFPPFPNRKEFTLYAYIEPAKEVGGDFYDFFLINEKKLCFVIADVSGKGVPAALFMVISKTLIKNQALSGLSTEEILITVNDILCLNNDENMFVTVFLAILEIDTGRLTYSNAGHNPPLIYKKDTNYDFVVSKKGFVLAGMEGIKYRENELMLAPGDEVFLYTDGVTEAMDEESTLYTEKRLKATLNSLKELEPKAVIEGVRNDIREHVKGAPQSDDITMLVIKYIGDFQEN